MLDDDDCIVVLDGGQARLVVHALSVFERLLRQGALNEGQLALLIGTDVGAVDPAADVIMAGVVAEASEPLRRQLT